MDPLTTTASVVALPLAGVPAAIAIHDKLDRFRPRRHIQKWTQRMEEITELVSQKDDMVPPHVMEVFLIMVERYMTARSAYQREIMRGSIPWLPFSNGRKVGKKFHTAAKNAWYKGSEVSAIALMLQETCALYHQHIPKNQYGKCPECVPEELMVLRRNAEYFKREDRLATWCAVVDSVRGVIDDQLAEGPSNVNLQGRITERPNPLHSRADEPPHYSDAFESETTAGSITRGPETLHQRPLVDSSEEIAACVIWDILSGPTDPIEDDERHSSTASIATPSEIDFNPWASLASLRSVIRKRVRPTTSC